MFLVLKAKNSLGKKDLPQEWPVKANPCAEDAEVPLGWEKMTRANLEALKAEHQAEYDQWKESKKAEQAKREKEQKDSEQASSKSAQAKLKLLQFSDEEIKRIMGVNYVE